MRRRIVVTDYQEEWATAFLEFKNYLEKELHYPYLRIEHVGSTSVEGLAAKPILDVLIILPDSSHFDIVKSRLDSIGYFHNGDQGIKDREVFKSRLDSPFYTHHLYVSYPNSISTKNQIYLRNHLRKFEQDRHIYGELKKQLAQQFEYDIDSYMLGKTDFILSVLKQYPFTKAELDEIIDANKQ